ncbi:fibronectin type III domain-containing protein [Sphingobacterium phlebotomi]|uniref:Fibronectin type III domain-containing protein n=1 Tax=Sphingobacterium phlebotomi TaxID=2605433 RepID=A0A5D4H811_9SPHI|nr:fibronectin type III domain-containing protein [Sphingobacterium phlebotomi]TYR36926.1 fibronectin type III domain-containing protein [Sphingobacterium phlebotomi]
MAIKPRALVGFGEMKDNEILVAANTILAAMGENPNFPTPIPSLEEVGTLTDDYANKLAAASKRGSPEDNALKKESKEALAEILQQLGHYVNSIAKGHFSRVLSSGFPTQGSKVLPQAPGVVDGLKLEDGRQSGQVQLGFNTQPNIRLYEYQYRKADVPDEPWSERFITTSSRGNVIAPLLPGVYYEARVRAINTHGIGDWSQIVRTMAR